MKPAQIFRQYIWIINTLRSRGRLTFEELSRKWQDEGVADGNPLLRHSSGIEVLQPLELREKMRQMIAGMLERY